MAESIKQTEAKSNVTPEYFLEIYRELKTAQRELETSAATRSAVLKRAKKGGIQLDALRMMDRLSNMDDDEAEALLAAVVRYASWAGKPFGRQLSLFDVSDHQVPTERAMQDHMEFLADDAGFSAGKSCDSADTNPHPPGRSMPQRGAQGWHKGQDAAAVMMTIKEDEESDRDAEAKEPAVARVAKGRRKAGAESRPVI